MTSASRPAVVAPGPLERQAGFDVSIVVIPDPPSLQRGPKGAAFTKQQWSNRRCNLRVTEREGGER